MLEPETYLIFSVLPIEAVKSVIQGPGKPAQSLVNTKSTLRTLIELLPQHRAKPVLCTTPTMTPEVSSEGPVTSRSGLCSGDCHVPHETILAFWGKDCKGLAQSQAQVGIRTICQVSFCWQRWKVVSKTAAQPESWELFYLAGLLRTSAQETASQVTLRELLQGVEGRARTYRHFAAKRTKDYC